MTERALYHPPTINEREKNSLPADFSILQAENESIIQNYDAIEKRLNEVDEAHLQQELDASTVTELAALMTHPQVAEAIEAVQLSGVGITAELESKYGEILKKIADLTVSLETETAKPKI